MLICLLTFCFLLPPPTINHFDEFEDLLADFESNDREDRIGVVLKVGELIDEIQDEQKLESGYRLLINAVGDRSDLVSTAAKMRLAEHGLRASPYLKPYFESKKLREFASACEAIKAIGPKAKKWIPSLAEHIESKNQKFQLAALHGLGVMEGEDLLPYLDQTIAALDSDNFNVQLSACRVISRIGPKANKAGPRLVKLLNEGIASSRSWASIALGAIGPHDDYDVVSLLAERLDRFYLVDRQRALIGLAYLGPQAQSAIPKIEKMMQDRSKSVQHTAARTHWKITGDANAAVKTLIPLIPTMEFGTEAMDILAEMGAESKDAVPALTSQLKSTEAPSRESAVYALASIGPDAKSALSSLETISQKDRDQLIREAAKFAIEKINNPEPPEK